MGKFFKLRKKTEFGFPVTFRKIRVKEVPFKEMNNKLANLDLPMDGRTGLKGKVSKGPMDDLKQKRKSKSKI